MEMGVALLSIPGLIPIPSSRCWAERSIWALRCWATPAPRADRSAFRLRKSRLDPVSRRLLPPETPVEVRQREILTAPPLVLSPDFFSQGGFTSFTLTGIGVGLPADSASLTPAQIAALLPPAVNIAPDTVIAPTAENMVAMINVPGQPSVVWKPVLEPLGFRTPVSLNFVATGANDKTTGLPVALGNFVLGQGAAIRTDPATSGSPASAKLLLISAQIIGLSGDQSSAPGGSITLKGASSFPNTVTSLPLALPTVNLGPQSLLSTAGTTVYTPNPYGEHTGYVLPGGNISVSGNLYAMAGSVLDVSGTSGMIDVPPASLGLNAQLDGPLTSPVVPLNSGLNFPLYSREVVRTRVDSNGGSDAMLAGGREFLL